MSWERAAGVYDLFVNAVSRKPRKTLPGIAADQIKPEDETPEYACGTGLLTGVIRK